MPSGIYSHNEHTVKLRLITWEGDRRVDHEFSAVMTRGAILERLELGVMFRGGEQESILLALPFGTEGSHYVAPCNDVSHYVSPTD